MIWAPVRNRYSDQRWTLDENSSLWKDSGLALLGKMPVRDESACGHHGTLVNLTAADSSLDPSLRRRVWQGGSNKQIEVGPISISGPFTVACWYKRTTSYADMIWETTYSGSNYYLGHCNGTGFNARPTSDGASTTTNPVPLNKWVFCGIIRNSANAITSFVDSNFVTSGTSQTKDFTISAFIGSAYGAYYMRNFCGDGMVWHRALSQAEILYLASRRPDCGIRSTSPVWMPSVSGSLPSTYTTQPFYGPFARPLPV